MLSMLANRMRRLEMTVDCCVIGGEWLKADLNHNLLSDDEDDDEMRRAFR